jgi:hypothetical protein
LSGKFRVEYVPESLVRSFWDASPQATAFTHPDVLGHCADRVEWLGSWRSEDLVAVWPICRSKTGELACSSTFLYYVGPLFSAEVHRFKYHRYQAVRQQALEAYIPVIVEHFPGLRFAMVPGEDDIRPFDWWNFDHPTGTGFVCRPRYTARIHQLGRPVDDIRQDFARNRKRDLRPYFDAWPVRSEAWHLDDLIALHDQPLQRQGIEVPEERRQALCDVVAAATGANGDVLAWRDPENGHLASFIVLLYGRFEANDVLCVAADSWRARGLSAWTTWQGMLHARALGKEIFDFNGANSPLRAADKHSFGAKAELYFSIDVTDDERRRW